MMRLVCSSRVNSKAAVDARDDKIKALQNLGRVIERTVSENVGFDAFEDAKAPAIAPVERIDHLMLGIDLIQLEPARVVGGLRVVGNAKICVAALARAIGHLLERVRPVREVGLQVNQTAHLFQRDKFGQVAFCRERDFVRSLAQLGRDEG